VPGASNAWGGHKPKTNGGEIASMGTEKKNANSHHMEGAGFKTDGHNRTEIDKRGGA